MSIAAQPVAATGQTLAQGASEQAASVQETSASAEQINSGTRTNMDRSRSSTELAGEASRQTAGALGALRERVESMQKIDVSSSKITKIINVIDEVAFQINILALNAAVEAARAGEAGLGFRW